MPWAAPEVSHVHRNEVERRLEGQTGTRLWKTLDAMLGSLTLFSSQAEERAAKHVPLG